MIWALLFISSFHWKQVRKGDWVDYYLIRNSDGLSICDIYRGDDSMWRGYCFSREIPPYEQLFQAKSAAEKFARKVSR